MKIITVEPIANGYALYNHGNYMMMFNRKENAEYIANLIEKVKEQDNKSYLYSAARSEHS